MIIPRGRVSALCRHRGIGSEPRQTQVSAAVSRIKSEASGQMSYFLSKGGRARSDPIGVRIGSDQVGAYLLLSQSPITDKSM